MKRIVFILMIFFVSLQAQFFEDYKEFARLMNYELDYEKARQKALQEHKKLLVVYVKEGCPFCHKMLEKLLIDKYVRNYIRQNFVPLILNKHLSEYIPPYLKTQFAPITYIIDPKTQKIEQTIMGYMEPEQYLWQFPSYKQTKVK